MAWVRGVEGLEELVVDGALDQDARPGAAVLAGVAEHRHRRIGGRLLDVGVGEHDGRRLAAELERHPGDVVGGGLEDARRRWWSRR